MLKLKYIIKNIFIYLMSYLFLINDDMLSSELLENIHLNDPLTGENLNTERSQIMHLRYGQVLYFSSDMTLTKFRENPNLAIRGASTTIQKARNVVDSAQCPVCGMSVEYHEDEEIPNVSFKRTNNQAIFTCSLSHAKEVANKINIYDKDFNKIDKKKMVADESNHLFCSGGGTTMLNGFRNIFHLKDCLILWFPKFLLNSTFKLIVGCILVFCLAVFNEFLIHVRRELKSNMIMNYVQTVSKIDGSNNHGKSPHSPLLSSSKRNPTISFKGKNIKNFPGYLRKILLKCGNLDKRSQHIVQCCFHGLTVFIAYLLMLAAMTYHLLLFFSVITGSTFGYYLYGEIKTEKTDIIGSSPLIS